MAAFYYGLIFGGRKCLHPTSQKRALSHAISLAVNYRLFSHGDVSYRFNGKHDIVVLEYLIAKECSLSTGKLPLISFPRNSMVRVTESLNRT